MCVDLAHWALYDTGDWFVQSEYTKRKSKSFVADTSAFYTTAGYRFNQLTPFVSYSTAKTLSKTDFEELPAIAPAAVALNQGINYMLQEASIGQKSASVGVRYDFTKSMDLKLQYDRIKIDDNRGSSTVLVQPNFSNKSPVNLYSVAVDFVF